MKNLWLAEVLEDFARLFYPRFCSACSNTLVKGEDVICTGCMLQMPQTQHHLDFHNGLHARLCSRIQIKYAMAMFKFSKRSRIQQLLHALKYHHQPEIGIILGKVYAQKLIDAGYTNAFDLILPVPLHPSRKRQRGYNQSAKFAEGLSVKLGIPFTDDALLRKVKTETQTRKAKLRRWENVHDIFALKDQGVIFKKRILVVDDVITTGSTLEACCQMLIDAGCAEISIACLAEA